MLNILTFSFRGPRWRCSSSGGRAGRARRVVSSHGVHRSGRLWEQTIVKGSSFHGIFSAELLAALTLHPPPPPARRFTECCPSGSPSLTLSAGTSKTIYFLLATSHRSVLNSRRSCRITEFITSFQVWADFDRIRSESCQSRMSNTFWFWISAGRGDPGHPPGGAEWSPSGKRRVQAQRHLCVCADRQRQNAGVCPTCHTGELPAPPSLI